MMRDMALPAVERDALLKASRERIAAIYASYYGYLGTAAWDDMSGEDRQRCREVADLLMPAALAAIEEQYVLIPRDQVTVEERPVRASCAGCERELSAVRLDLQASRAMHEDARLLACTLHDENQRLRGALERG